MSPAGLYWGSLDTGLGEGLNLRDGDWEGDIRALSSKPGLCTGETCLAGDLAFSNKLGLALTAGDLH